MIIVDEKSHARSVVNVHEVPNYELNSLKGFQCIKGNSSSFSYSSAPKNSAINYLRKLIFKMVNDAADM